MRLIALTFLFLSLTTSTSSHAAKISEARVKLDGGFAIFELYDEPARLPSCSGGNALGALAKIEKEGKQYGYGTGCWSADMQGNIHLHIQGFDPGPPRETVLHNSAFKSVAVAVKPRSVKRTYKEARAGLHHLESIGLCSACADNVAQHYVKSPDSKCGKLANQVLNHGNADAALTLIEFPEYCTWKY